MWTLIIKQTHTETKRPLSVQIECNSVKKANCALRAQMKEKANLYAVSMTAVRNSKNKMNIKCTNIGYAPRTNLESLIQKICAKCNCLDR